MNVKSLDSIKIKLRVDSCDDKIATHGLYDLP